MNPNLLKIMLAEYEVAQGDCERLVKRIDEIFSRYLTGIAFLIPGLCFIAANWPESHPPYATAKSRVLAIVAMGSCTTIILTTLFTLNSIFRTLKQEGSAQKEVVRIRSYFEDAEPKLKERWHPMRQYPVTDKTQLAHWLGLGFLASLFSGILVYAYFLTRLDYNALARWQVLAGRSAGFIVFCLMSAWVFSKRSQIVKANALS